MLNSTTALLAVLAVAAIAPIVAAACGRISPLLVVPAVVLELVLGVVIGPNALDLAADEGFIAFLAQLGLGFLFFFAGYEIRFDRIKGRPLRNASLAWAASLALAYPIAAGLEAVGAVESGLLVGSALTTTALGILIPILRDSGRLESPLGRHVLASGSVGEFGPILIVTILLTTQGTTLPRVLLLVAFVVVALAAALLSSGAVGRSFDFLSGSIHTFGQLPVRLTVLLLFALVVIARDLGLDVVLGAFAAGMIVRTALGERDVQVFESKLDAVGFGLLIPFFFIASGMAIDFDSLVSSPGTLIDVPMFLLLFLLVRGLPTWWFGRRDMLWNERASLSLMSATALPLVVAITTIGIERGEMRPTVAASLVAAAVLSVLIYPALAQALTRGNREPVPHAAAALDGTGAEAAA